MCIDTAPPQSRARTLLDAVTELDIPREVGAAYVAGEAKTCQMIHHYLVGERG